MKTSRVYTTIVWIVVITLLCVAGFGVYKAYQFISGDRSHDTGIATQQDMLDDELFNTNIFRQLESHGEYPVRPEAVGKQNPFE